MAFVLSPERLFRRARFRSRNAYEQLFKDAQEKFMNKWFGPIAPGQQKLSDFEILKNIGKGSFGQVVLAAHKDAQGGDKSFVALKVLSKRRIMNKRDLDHVVSERKIHSCASFEFLVSLQSHFQDNANVVLCLEFVPGGDFFSLLKAKNRYGEKAARFYGAQIVLAIEYLHRMGVVYRDLKPENVLVDAAGYLKIADFGFAKLLLNGNKTYTLCGTPEYFAPELLSHSPYGTSVDFWSFGIFMYEMLVGRTAFYNKHQSVMFRRILYDKVTFPNDISLSEEARHLLRSLLHKVPSKRIGSCKEIRKHPWFRSIDFLAVYAKTLRAPCIPDCARVISKMKDIDASVAIETSDEILFKNEFADF